MNHSILFIAKRDLEVNKRRYRLVRLSIAISVLLIVLVMLISNSFYNKMIKEMTVANKNVVTVAFGFVIDAYGAGPFMVATKIKGMVAAEVSDERSAYMTRGHNNSRMITMGAEIVGDELAKNIAKGFVNGKYDGGRHQIRVDMLNKMC